MRPPSPGKRIRDRARGKGVHRKNVKTDVCINPDETLDDLQLNGLAVIQKRDSYRFGVDAVLLANFACVKRGARVVELCSGSGVISILMSAKTQAQSIVGVEIQPAFVEMANRSAAMNRVGDRVSFIHADLRERSELPKRASIDAVVVNPPYIPLGVGAKSAVESKRVACHEVCCALSDALAAAAWLLRPGGAFFIVHRAGRAADVLCGMREAGIEPRTVQFAHPDAQSPAALVLVEGWVHPNARRSNALCSDARRSGCSRQSGDAADTLSRSEVKILAPTLLERFKT